MTKKQRALEINELLKNEYADAKCTLNYRTDYELLIATRLSAQCTDERVNMITSVLFERYKSLDEFAKANINELERIIKSCGFYHEKAKNIKDMCNMLINDYNGILPDTIDELVKLPGVGRKTANLIVGEIFNKPAVVVDTHCIRLSNRLGLCDTKDPAKIEVIIKKLLPYTETMNFCHCLVYHGRKVCTARKPKCGECILQNLCKYYSGIK